MLVTVVLCIGRSSTQRVPPLPRYVDTPRFDPLHDNLEGQAFFKQHGFAVYKGATRDELERAWDLFWQYLEGFGTGVRRAEPATWTNDRWPSPGMSNGIMPFFGIGQSDFMWYLRALPRVRAAFATLWGTESLLASMDGVIIYRSQDPSIVASARYWWHVDQNPRSLPSFDCVQGLFQMTRTSLDAGSIVLIPGSHNMYPLWYEGRYGKILDLVRPDMQFFAIPSFDTAAHQELAPLAVQPHMEAGDLIVWNSTLLHCSIVGDKFANDKDRDAGNWSTSSLGRVAALLTMTPRDKASAEVLQLRKDAARAGVTTTHWPHRYHDAVYHNIASWQAISEEYKSQFSMPRPPMLSAEQLRLVGYSRQEAERLSPEGLTFGVGSKQCAKSRTCNRSRDHSWQEN